MTRPQQTIPFHPVLDVVAIKGWTLRGWLVRCSKAFRNQAASLRADTAQSEPLARENEARAEALEHLLLDLETSSLPDDKGPVKR